MKVYLIAFFLIPQLAFAIPDWAKTSSQNRKGNIYQAVCSGTGPSIALARQEATESCQQSAGQQLITNIEVKSLSIETEKDVLYQQEIRGKTRYIRLICKSKKEEIEELYQQYKIWLLCEFDLTKARAVPLSYYEKRDKQQPGQIQNKDSLESLNSIPSTVQPGKYMSSKNRIITIATIPQCNEMIITGSGRYVVFHSLANNLVSGDNNGKTDVFVRDRQTGTTSRISVDSSENEVNGESGFPSISNDGNLVVFVSNATNLVASDTNDEMDVFIRNIPSGTTNRVSVDSSSTEANGPSSDAKISGNGSIVVFSSKASNLVSSDSNDCLDVFAHEVSSGTTTIVSQSTGGTYGNSDSWAPDISLDGRYISFTSRANNLVGSDSNEYGDIFLRDRQTPTTELVSLNSSSGQIGGRSTSSSVSDDGRYITFTSNADGIVPGDSNGLADVFMYDRIGTDVTFISQGGPGTNSNGKSDNSFVFSDGSKVAFESYSSNLVNDDSGSFVDIYVKDNSNSGQVVEVESVSSSYNEETDTNVSFRFKRYNDVSSSLTVDFEISGSATDKDYVIPYPLSIDFPVDEDEVVLNLPIINDFYDELIETVKITISYSTNYYVGYSNTASINIIDSEPIEYGKGAHQLAQTYGAEVNLTGEPIGGGEGYREIFPEEMADHIVSDQSGLKKLFDGIEDEENKEAHEGDIVFVDDSFEITDSTTFEINVDNITIASNRGVGGSPGAEIRSSTEGDKLFVVNANNFRMTGLKITGPNPGTEETDLSRGIELIGENSQIDNCEFSGWSHAAISFFSKGGMAKHNDIHDNQRTGFGYGILVRRGASVVIEGNTFDFNRHAIATGGNNSSNDTSYIIRFNIFKPNHTHLPVDSHFIDGDEFPESYVTYASIHHNSFYTTESSVCITCGQIGIEGVPGGEVKIFNNWFVGNPSTYPNVTQRPNGSGPDITSGFTNITVYQNTNQPDDWGYHQFFPSDRKKAVDLDGDSIVDRIDFQSLSPFDFVASLFELATGWSSDDAWDGNGSDIGMTRYKTGDFNGDGKTDILSHESNYKLLVWLSTGTNFDPSPGHWATNGGDVHAERYRIGDFDGNGKADLLEIGSSGGFHIWLSTGAAFSYSGQWGSNGGSVPESDLDRFRLGDFNGDGKTDIVKFASDYKFYIWLAQPNKSFSSEGSWGENGGDIGGKRYKVGDFNGDNMSDIMSLENSDVAATFYWLSEGDEFSSSPTIWFNW